MATNSNNNLRAQHRLLANKANAFSCIEQLSDASLFGDCHAEYFAVFAEAATLPIDYGSRVLSYLSDWIEEQIKAGERDLFKTTYDGNDDLDITMRLTSPTNFKFLAYDRESDARLYFSMEEEGEIRLKLFSPEVLFFEPAIMTGISLSFSSAEQWHTTSRYYVDSCQEYGPNIVAVDLRRDNDIWRGKTMLYDVGEAACNETNHPGQAGWYTDFVGDDMYTTASVYFFPMDVTAEDLASPERYGYDKLCDNIPDHQFCAAQFAHEFLTEDLSEFRNPFCITACEFPSRGAACESDKTEIKQADFSVANGWILPKELRDVSVCVPTDIDDLDSCVSF